MFALRPFPDVPTHRYKIYGLSIVSDLRLPELPEDEGDGEADVRISGAVVAGSEEGISFGPDGAVLHIKGIASYLIRDGRGILVDPAPDAVDRNVRLYLLGSAFGILLHQRGLLPLHANAIEIDGHAVAFMGETGAGKSTLAAWLHDAGHRVIADDVCVLDFGEGGQDRIRVRPGMPRIRLWKDALERSGRVSADYEFSYAGDESYEKFDVPVSPERSTETDLDLVAIYVLSTGESFDISRLSGVDAADAVFSNTYRGFVLSELGQSRLHFDAALKVVRSTPIFRLERSRRLEDIAGDVSRVIAHARSLVEPAC